MVRIDLSHTRIAEIIDQSLLVPEATIAELTSLCDEAGRLGFGHVCVNSAFVEAAVERLEGTDVSVCSVVGFPFGACDTEVKAYEAAVAAGAGADEVDMVINVGWLRGGDDRLVAEDIEAVVAAAAQNGAAVKVILETALLSEEQKRRACRLSLDAGAAFVKTSTGFGPGGATAADVRLLSAAVAPRMGVKASGGIRDLDTLLVMVDAGATRVGTSNGAGIVSEAVARGR